MYGFLSALNIALNFPALADQLERMDLDYIDSLKMRLLKLQNTAEEAADISH